MQPKLPLFFTANLAVTAVSSSAAAREGKGDNRKDMKTPENLSPDALERALANKIRLDAALAQVFPDMGVRGRRRFWEWCAVMVNGKPRAPGFMVAHGDAIGIVPQDSAYGEAAQSSLVLSGGTSCEASCEASHDASCEAIGPRGALSASPSLSSTSPALSDAPPVTPCMAPSLAPLDDSHNGRDLHSSNSSHDRTGSALEEWLKAIQLVAMTPDYLVFYKPCGLHTAHVAGAGSMSLEACLPLFMERYGHNLEAVCLHQGGHAEEGVGKGGVGKGDMDDGAVEESPVDIRGVNVTREKQSKKRGRAATAMTQERPQGYAKEHTPFLCPLLLTRLDFETSGLVLAARTPAAQGAFRQWELQGKVEKTYLAVAWGKVGKGVVKNALNMKNRRQTAVLEHEGETTRWTAYAGVAVFNESKELVIHEDVKETLSLVKVTIRRGARHQIRAHLAFMGHPLWGDALYGGEEGAKGSLPSADLGEGYFFLHYGRLRMPGVTAWVLPDRRWARWLVQGRQAEGQLAHDGEVNFYELLMGEG